jgi:hypothetical protein
MAPDQCCVKQCRPLGTVHLFHHVAQLQIMAAGVMTGTYVPYNLINGCVQIIGHARVPPAVREALGGCRRLLSPQSPLPAVGIPSESAPESTTRN